MKFVLFVFGFLSGSALAVQMPCVDASSACKASLPLSSSFTSEYFRSFSIESKNPDITRAVIVVHGILRDADEYFSTVVSAARAAGELAHVVLIAPKFKSKADKPSKGELFWPVKPGSMGIPRRTPALSGSVPMT